MIRELVKMKTYLVVFLIAGMLLLSSDTYAADLSIASMADITANCPYDSGTRTYSCTGWSNIYITGDISLPSDCSYDRSRRCGSYLVGCNARNIIFKAGNEFRAKSFYTTASGRSGGSLTIEAKSITADSLNTYGTYCSPSDCNCGGPRCGSSNAGGPITLKAESVSITTLNANDGAGGGGRGGTITVTADTLNIQNIYSSGSDYSCSYSGGYDNGAGSGGSVTIKSRVAKINSVSMDGGRADYCSSGGSGGSAKIVADTLTLGTVSANGNTPGGSGGSTKIYADNYTLTSVTENGASGSGCGTSSCCRGPGSGGFVGIFADANFSSPTFSLSRGSLYYCNSCYGCCFWSYGSEGSIIRAKRTGSGFFTLETNLASSAYNSYGIRIKDVLTGENVKSIYGADYGQEGTIASRFIKALVGMETKLRLKLGKDYRAVITASTEPYFDSSRCGTSATCENFTIPFTEY